MSTIIPSSCIKYSCVIGLALCMTTNVIANYIYCLDPNYGIITEYIAWKMSPYKGVLNGRPEPQIK